MGTSRKDRRIGDLMSNTSYTSAKKIGHSRVLWTGQNVNGEPITAIRYHDTDIAVQKDGLLWLTSGGWRTATTKLNINRALDYFNYPGFIHQNRSIWYYDSRLKGIDPYIFFDGMIIDHAGNIRNPSLGTSEQERIQKTVKQINNYCRVLREQIRRDGRVPRPTNGDCWGCLLRTESGSTMGDVFGDTEHLVLHLKEKYIHGSLILNALEHAGYKYPALIAGWFIDGSDHCVDDDSVIRAVRRYLKDKLHIGR